MKKHLLLSVAMLSAGALSAQVTVTEAHLAPMGSVIPQAQDTLPNNLTAGSNGANQTWNYASLNEHLVDTMTFTNPAWTANGADFPASNFAAVINNADGEFVIYLDKSATRLEIIGQAADFFGTGTPVSIDMDPSQVIINFPANYLDTYVGASRFDVTLDGSPAGIDSIRIISAVDRNYEIDGWGSITTPIGTYDVLRIELNETTVDSTWGLVVGIWQLFNSSVESSTSYDWWTADASVGFPVMSMDVDGNGDATSITYLKALPSPDGVTEMLDGSKVSVYPNPTSSYVNFVIESDNARSIEVYDATGKLIEAQQVERLATTFNMSNASAGIYFYNLKNANGEMLHSGQFSVVR